MKQIYLILPLLFLSACGDATTPATNDVAVNEAASTAASNEFHAENQKYLADYAKKAPPYDKLPEIPLQFSCDRASGETKAICETDQAQMIKDWAGAWAGDYQAQRNVAYMLSNNDVDNINQIPDKGDGIFIIGQTKIAGCAWRIVNQKSGHIEYSSSDDDQLKSDCGRLDADQKAAADAQAKTILSKITK